MEPKNEQLFTKEDFFDQNTAKLSEFRSDNQQRIYKEENIKLTHQIETFKSSNPKCKNYWIKN